MIAEQTGGELYEIICEQPYTSEDLNYTDPNSRVSQEHDYPDLQTIPLSNAHPDNWESVETVFIGYPIWWGEAVWPVSSFVQENDFEGKTVYPFCTSASSSLGNSGVHLADLAKTGDWKEGMRFSSSVSEDDVQTWIASLE